MSDKVMVEWIGERSKGKRPLVKCSDVKQGKVCNGEKVKVVWGKSKKLFGAIIVARECGFLSPDIPQQKSATPPTATEDFSFELGSPGPVRSSSSATQPEQKPLTLEDIRPLFSHIEERFSTIRDSVDGLCARLVARMDEMEDSIAALGDRLDSCTTMVTATLALSDDTQIQRNIPGTPVAWVEPDRPIVPTATPLQDVTSIARPTTNDALPEELVLECLQSCKTLRNLAARLSARVFTDAERIVSNCRGMVGKKALNQLKVRAIFGTYIQKYPLERMETVAGAEKEMRTAIEQGCRKLMP